MLNTKEKLIETGIYSIIDNSAINIRKKIITEKSGNMREFYNISIMVGIEYVFTDKEIYSLMEIVKEIVDYLEQKDIENYLKPNYEIWFISFKPYSRLAVSLLNMIKKPIRTKVYLKTINDINNLFINQSILLDDDKAVDTTAKHIFVAYSANNSDSEITASKVVEYLKSKDVPVWYFPSKVSWGDSITSKEEEAIHNAYASIICYTSDFLEGKTALQEYNALMAKKREKNDFKVGMILINCEPTHIPPFMKDSFYLKISNPNDPMFESIMESIYNSIIVL